MGGREPRAERWAGASADRVRFEMPFVFISSVDEGTDKEGHLDGPPPVG